MTTVTCLNLHIKGYNNIQEWMNDSNNVYIGSSGYTYIKQKLFQYSDSKWMNPFEMTEYYPTEPLTKYVIYLFKSGIIYDIHELEGKNLGCNCDKQKGNHTCHAQILSDLLNKCYEPLDRLINQKREIQLIPSLYRGRNKLGDFSWMITQPEYNNALFIFNDNEDAFLKHSCERGAGNAIIRPYQCQKHPKATGIPTGIYIPGVTNAGYTSLSPRVKQVIDQSINRIRILLDTYRYTHIIYSAAGRHGGLGTGIFKVGNDVKTYIIKQLRGLL
jgi:hypothetical protein